MACSEFCVDILNRANKDKLCSCDKLLCSIMLPEKKDAIMLEIMPAECAKAYSGTIITTPTSHAPIDDHTHSYCT